MWYMKHICDNNNNNTIAYKIERIATKRPNAMIFLTFDKH
jgi:hypothetical protein